MLPLLAGLALLVGGILVVTWWDEIVDWLKDFIPKINKFFQDLAQQIAHAAAIFVERLNEGMVAIRHKLYYKEEGTWMEKTTTRKVKESEVPPFIRDKIRNQEENITKEMEQELQLEI
ncbi:MAG: hypothetical protein VZR11_03790 [Succinimonas sp.]|nr:hypothetical protein [Succinimonas sp.]